MSSVSVYNLFLSHLESSLQYFSYNSINWPVILTMFQGVITTCNQFFAMVPLEMDGLLPDVKLQLQVQIIYFIKQCNLFIPVQQLHRRSKRILQKSNNKFTN